jgi:MOSC domain-containing protein YiiM
MIVNAPAGSVRSVNVSPARTIQIGGNAVATAIMKLPVAGRVAVRGVNVAGDDQADRRVHGGPDRAVYAYATEDYAWFSAQLGRELAPGTFGENLTLDGIDVTGAKIGERWRAGTTLLQVTAMRVPCFKLAHVMGDGAFIRTFAEALRPGAYLRIVEEGELAAGDPVTIVARPGHELTIGEMTRIFLFDRARAGELLTVPELPEEWRTWAQEHAPER